MTSALLVDLNSLIIAKEMEKSLCVEANTELSGGFQGSDLDFRDTYKCWYVSRIGHDRFLNSLRSSSLTFLLYDLLR